ncbi:unnamed protein product, partial [Amoebophrya sp. A25]
YKYNERSGSWRVIQFGVCDATPAGFSRRSRTRIRISICSCMAVPVGFGGSHHEQARWTQAE